MQMLDFIISALTSARSAAAAAIPAVVQPAVKAVTVDGFQTVPVVGSVVPVVEELATKIAAIEAGEVETSVASHEVRAHGLLRVRAGLLTGSQQPSLDALV